MKRKLLTVAIAGMMGVAAAQTAVASQLYFDFNRNTMGNLANASIFLFGAANQEVAVSNLAGFNQNVALNADGFFNVPIANIYQQSGTGIHNTGFLVDSAQPVAGYFVNRAGFSTDMTYLLDRGALDKNYVVASQGGGFGEGSQVAIHAITDGTAVTFTPRGGAPIDVSLNAGETYKYAGGGTDLTGSLVSANNAVAVFAGHECGQVPVGATYCDTLLEQMIPTSKLSQDYLLTASKGSQLATNDSDLVRVVATQDGTEVRVDGGVKATLNTGDSHEFLLPTGTGAHVEASAPVAIAQYLTGGGGANTDPAMSMVPGADTWLESYRLATPIGAQQFVENYASIVIDSDILGSLKLDGITVNTGGFDAIGATGFSRGIVDLPLGLFNLTASDPFLVMLGGGSNADSYFTYGGSTFAPGISEPPLPPSEVPEPNSLLLVGVGILALAGIGRRRWSV